MVVGQIAEPVDFVVVGAGPGGYAAALRASQLGRKVLLVDRDGADGVGGVCLRVGCIPSKALIEVADLAERARDASRFGVDVDVKGVDMAQFQKWKTGVVDGLTGGVRGLLDKAGVDVARGTFRFTGPDRGVITPEGEDQLRFIKFKDLVLATGSRPVELCELPFDDETILDSTGALALKRLPKTLAIVGAGYIGLEIGIALAKLGSKVTIVEAEDRILPTMDRRLARPVATTLSKLDIDIRLKARAQGQSRGKLVIKGSDGDEKIAAECIIVAVGRRPNTDDLSLGEVRLNPGEDGLLQVAADRRMAPHIAAIGDITPGPALAHKATAEAIVAAEALCGQKTAFQPQVIPAVVFADPEIATVGLSVDDAKSDGIDAQATMFPLSASGRAKTLGTQDGFLQLVSDTADGRVIGVHIVGPHASDLIGEGALAIEMGATQEDLALTIHAHPTLGELYPEAAHLALGQPIHMALTHR